MSRDISAYGLKTVALTEKKRKWFRFAKTNLVEIIVEVKIRDNG